MFNQKKICLQFKNRKQDSKQEKRKQKNDESDRIWCDIVFSSVFKAF